MGITKKLKFKELKTKDLLNKLSKTFPYLDLSDSRVYREFCIRYGEAIAPELRKIDQWQARSYGAMFTRVVR